MKSKRPIEDFDIPPPITAAQQHGVYPQLNHDERARLNFVSACNRVVTTCLSPGNQTAYDAEVLPAFQKQHGRLPNSRHEVRRAMNDNSFHRLWGATRRNLMEIRQQAGAAVVLRQLDELAERARHLNDGDDNLVLDKLVKIPPYVAEVDHHCMPGSYYRELVDGDVSPAANYDIGFFVTTGGTVGPLNDEAGKAIAQWVKDSARQHRPEFKPRRILDIGVAAGHNIVPIAKMFPDAQVTALDVSAPMLRYAHARAKSLGVQNIRFVQMSGEDLSAFDDESFDWVQTSVFLHELSAKALPRVLSECRRVLKPGGLTLHLEQPQYDDNMPIFEQFMRDWDAYNNSEPFWTAMHAIDMDTALAATGFDASDVFHAELTRAHTQAPTDGDNQAGQDFGREPVWHAYGAWRSDWGANHGQR
ncbi:MAG: class I SAM-dependent methyltransferase [Pseudomonadota bacterium]